MNFETPVLFLIYNRIEETKKVFYAIREMKPTSLFIACDGPKESSETDKAKVEEVRKFVIDNIDWDCNYELLFRPGNLGCRQSVSDSITWFFNKVEMGIILEDDCLPGEDFFCFCKEMLIKYKDDTRVWHIDGSNFVIHTKNTYDYHFSKYFLIWGWATWRRAWNQYRVNMPDYPLFKEQKALRNVWKDSRVVSFWENELDAVYFRNFDTWDFQWFFTIWSNNGLSIRPNQNLIKNIGFSSEATHTKKKHKIFSSMEIGSIQFPIKHPVFCLQDENRDNECSRIRFNIRPFIIRLFNKLFNL